MDSTSQETKIREEEEILFKEMSELSIFLFFYLDKKKKNRIELTQICHFIVISMIHLGLSSLEVQNFVEYLTQITDAFTSQLNQIIATEEEKVRKMRVTDSFSSSSSSRRVISKNQISFFLLTSFFLLSL